MGNDLVHPLSRSDRIERLCYGFIRMEFKNNKYKIPIELMKVCHEYVGTAIDLQMKSPTEIKLEQHPPNIKIMLLGLDAAII